MGAFRVVVTDHDFDDLEIERDVLGDIADLIDASDDVGGTAVEQINAELEGADAVLNLRYPIGETQFRRMPDCRIVARYGIGVDNVDLEAATERGVPVTNVPEYCTEEVAIHATSLALALLRQLKPFDASVENGSWNRSEGGTIHRLSTLTIGVVGYGAIGQTVAEKFLALGADVVTSDPYVEESDVTNREVELVSFDELVARADIVTIHSPLTEATRGLFDADVFEQLRDGAYLVNVARGPIVERDALYAALESGDVAGAGLDVFPKEPPSEDDPLRNHPAVITTPHVAWYSEEANVERRRTAAINVRQRLSGDVPEHVVNEIGASDMC